MAIKFNKELLLKHRFWIMLGVAGFLVLSGMTYLEVFVDAEGAKKKLDDTLKNTKNVIPKINPQGIKVLQDVITDDAKKEAKIWSEAYKEEEPYFIWPKEVEETFHFASGYFAIDIKISKLPPVKDWPKNEDDKDMGEKLVHGTFVSQDQAGFLLKRADGKTVLICPIHTDTVKVTTEDGKTIEFRNLKDEFRDLKEKNASAGKLLTIKYQKGRYFNDPLTSTEQDAFAESYKKQIHPILEMVDPLDEKGNGVVQLRDWLYKPSELPDPGVRFIRWVDDEWKNGKPAYKEAWIAQEDLWIQKEIYRMIADANKKISDFQGKGGNQKNKTFTFLNPNFQVDLTLDAKDKLTFKIKNRLDRQQALDLSFRVLLNNSDGFTPEVFRISGDPLKPAGDKAGKDSLPVDFPVEKSPRNAIVRVQQVLTWQTAAVKRIDQISIGDANEQAHSHRTFGDAPLRPFDPKDGEGAVAVKGGPAPRGPIGKGKNAPNKPANPGAGGIVPVAVNGNMGGIDHQLWTHRYVGDGVGVTDQYRRIPVAVVLIVDQDHVDRVLTSFNNSKLRYLPTQVLLNQYPGSLQPPSADAEKPAPARPPGTRGPGPAPAPPPQAGAGAANDTETNMELVIYGIMTLYQRYPKMPAPPPVTPK